MFRSELLSYSVQIRHNVDTLENYKGICLGFDIPENNLLKVKYVAERAACPREFESVRLQ